MFRAVDHIKDINDTKEIWKLAIKVDDIWTNVKSSKEYAEMIVRDIQGDSIHVLIGPEEFKKRKADLEELMKLKTYTISNFRLITNEDKFKLTDHVFKMQFHSGTTIKPNEMPTMPLYYFKFMKFEDIKAMTFREDLLVDVIGAVHEIGSAQTTATTGKLNISFRIKDLGGTILDCILWESVASKFMEYCKNRIEEGPLIIIIRRARLQKPTDRFPLQISNAWTGTKLVINEDIPAINDFKKRLPADNSYAIQNKMMSYSSQRFASSASGSQLSPEDHFIQGNRIIKLADMIKLPKDEICVTVVKTKFVRTSDRGWYMLGCKECIKETKPLADGSYECAAAERHKTTAPVLRYRLDVQVGDGADNAKFVFWDSSCIDLLGVTAGELQKTMFEDGVIDRLEYPTDFDEMMGRTFAFRVKWQKEWKQGSVLECKDSKVLVDRIQKELNGGGVGINPIGTTSESAKLLEVESTPSNPVEVECTQSKEPIIQNIVDDLLNVSQDLSATADFDPQIQSSLTPSKRSPAKEKDDDILSGQLSSTRLIKTRSSKIIKTEMP
ncbi:replication protein A 70 kDa DNA-binding subunit C [Trifolium repens]|nr:replication protein A 70 kDa DNA-binding subunit C [Trifolium repens]